MFAWAGWQRRILTMLPCTVSPSFFERLSMSTTSIFALITGCCRHRSAYTNFSRLCCRPFKISDIDDSDVIVVFGTDLLREHHNEYLRVRKACDFNNARVFSINPFSVKCADVARIETVYKPGTDETVINAICLAAIEEGLVDSKEAEAYRQKVNPSNLKEAAGICGLDEADLKAIARALVDSKKVSFIAGEIITRSIARESIAASLINLNKLLGIMDKGQMAVLPRYANSMGAEKLGLLPYPFQELKKELAEMWGCYPDNEPQNTDAMLALMKKEEINGLLIMGGNPVMLYPDREFVREGLEKLEFLVACDLFETETTALADVVLPLSSWAEYDGNYINLEGKVQLAHRAIKPVNQAKPGYEIINLLAEKFEVQLFESDEARQVEIDRILKLTYDNNNPREYLEVAPETYETDDEYPYVLFIGDDPHHIGYLTEKAPSLTNFVGEAYIEISPDVASKHELENGNLVRIESRVGKIIAPVKISDYIENNVVFIPRNFSSTPVTSLLMRKQRLDLVKLSKVDV